VLQVHATNAWVELNTQCSTSTRRGRRVAKLVDWLNEREEHEELELVIEEDLIAYCTTELRAFCGEADGGIEEVFSAGAAAACEAVLRCPDGQTGSGHLLATAFMDTLMLLATLCADDAVRIIFFPLASRCTLLSG